MQHREGITSIEKRRQREEFAGSSTLDEEDVPLRPRKRDEIERVFRRALLGGRREAIAREKAPCKRPENRRISKPDHKIFVAVLLGSEGKPTLACKGCEDSSVRIGAAKVEAKRFFESIGH